MPAKPRRSQLRRAALTSAIDLFVGGDAPPTEFRIFSAGINSSTKGDFLFDEEAAAMVMASARRHGVDFTIDYDHHTLRTAQGVKAVSAGWFGLELRQGELWATNVRWNPDALEHLAKREYRYFSPLFDWDSKNGRITELINNALTNTPALHELEALVAASSTTDTEGEDMDPKLKEALDRITELERLSSAKDERIRSLEGQNTTVALSAAVGLASTAGSEEIRGKIVALAGFRKDVLAIAGKDSDGAAIGALSAMKEQAGEVATLRDQVEKAQTAALSADFKAHLDGLSTVGVDGKFLSPAKRKKAEALAQKLGGGKLTPAGVEAAKEYVVDMLEPGSGGGGDEGKGNDGVAKPKGNLMALSQQQKDVARRLGIAEADYAKKLAETA
jgi:phage I-like protein